LSTAIDTNTLLDTFIINSPLHHDHSNANTDGSTPASKPSLPWLRNVTIIFTFPTAEKNLQNPPTLSLQE
jgi:hypothetical protein